MLYSVSNSLQRQKIRMITLIHMIPNKAVFRTDNAKCSIAKFFFIIRWKFNLYHTKNRDPAYDASGYIHERNTIMFLDQSIVLYGNLKLCRFELLQMYMYICAHTHTWNILPPAISGYNSLLLLTSISSFDFRRACVEFSSHMRNRIWPLEIALLRKIKIHKFLHSWVA